ncbi:MAG: alpha/beta hydrolase [Desulfobacterales bacterium]
MIKLAGLVLVVYVVYSGFLFLIQRKIMFPHYMIDVPAEGEVNVPGTEKIWLKTGGEKLESWYLPPGSKQGVQSTPAVIFAHGNGELIDFWPVELNRFAGLNIGVMLVEYPGYGRSQGTPSQSSITDAFVTAYDKLCAREDVDDSKIILVGRSLGGGAVCALAAKRPAAALILMSTFTSARSFATKYLIPGFFARDPFDNLSVVSSFDGPVLIMHGKKDEVIPYSHGLALWRAAKSCKMITYDSGHNDSPPDWGIFMQDVESFLRASEII